MVFFFKIPMSIRYKYDREVEVTTWKCKWYEAPMRMDFMEVICKYLCI